MTRYGRESPMLIDTGELLEETIHVSKSQKHKASLKERSHEVKRRGLIKNSFRQRDRLFLVEPPTYI